MKSWSIALLITIAVATVFWAHWIHEVKVYRAEVATITKTLRAQNLTMIHVFPLSENCYTWNAMADDTRAVSGTICTGEEDE